MKVIGLLNKITNGEEVPKKIFYSDKIWYWDIKAQDYVEDDKRLFNYYIADELMDSLNDEVEIIEEDKKIEKLEYIEHIEHDNGFAGYPTNAVLTRKINEIIDFINKEKE